MDLIWSDEHEDRRPTVIPERSVKPNHLRRVNTLHLFEVNKRRILGAQYAIKFQQIKGTPQNVALRGAHSRDPQFRLTGEKVPGTGGGEAEFTTPCIIRGNAHGHPIGTKGGTESQEITCCSRKLCPTLSFLLANPHPITIRFLFACTVLKSTEKVKRISPHSGSQNPDPSRWPLPDVSLWSRWVRLRPHQGRVGARVTPFRERLPSI